MIVLKILKPQLSHVESVGNFSRHFGFVVFFSYWVMMVGTSCSNYCYSLQFVAMPCLHYLQLLMVVALIIGL
jgi:hypothetical protein